MKKLFVILIAMITSLMDSSLAKAQSSNEFEGVYVVEEPAVLLVILKSEIGFDGFVSDGKNIFKLKGIQNDDVLTLTMAEGTDKSENYAALDESGNLVVTDQQLNIMYFLRSKENALDVYSQIQNQLQPNGEKETSVNAKEVNKNENPMPLEKINNVYAGKKFLHLYTGNGMTEKWAYYLFEDGRFYFRSNSSYISNNSFSDFSAAMSSDNAGTWSVKTINNYDYMFLNWNDGKSGKLKIQKTSSGYLLGDTKYFLVGLDEFEE